MSGFPNPGDASGYRRGPCMAPVGVEAAAQMVECEDAGNVLLDLFEHQVRSLLAAGLELQVRARVDRLLPSLSAPRDGSAYRVGTPFQDAGSEEAARVGTTGAPAVGAAVAGDRQADKQDRALSFSAVLTALGIAERRRLSAAEHDLVSRCKGWIRREMESLRA